MSRVSVLLVLFDARAETNFVIERVTCVVEIEALVKVEDWLAE